MRGIRVVATARHYSKTIERPVNESIVCYIEKACMPSLRAKIQKNELKNGTQNREGHALLLGGHWTQTAKYRDMQRKSGNGVVEAAARGIV